MSYTSEQFNFFIEFWSFLKKADPFIYNKLNHFLSHRKNRNNKKFDNFAYHLSELYSVYPSSRKEIHSSISNTGLVALTVFSNELIVDSTKFRKLILDFYKQKYVSFLKHKRESRRIKPTKFTEEEWSKFNSDLADFANPMDKKLGKKEEGNPKPPKPRKH
ncbi:MAG: hypothetical protein JW703_02250 [Candidatus Diapherotrites archaeon]|nr:hypothetical protein [Candidatus Diapherotrites archaeon]